ncbi:thioredoxin domain-containing protein 4 precursor, putative [Perkinsus marinus ATCC 50983]|uniref:protein disulfide-isomerase n=1 Tax=Perkinsus marinus (strain ATCC 50983 / TXsc) TaxID=423536 RepID=C5LFW6_PERM5|nr:thioredoxin domain-containing protein 4 precursor, putative [Perkinsus marinus ATCC 50983]EER04383.1 thioredoxin domain-containing protein 4 precursor, putative [Perkinsus marinus ATCC 50983]|eukprot:XP_002772567.1 thioredoxin domain-containing protein 4 precursor, putative [Perkinsus marinus ATCC 50983]
MHLVAHIVEFKPFFDNAVEKLAMHDPPMRFGMIDGIQYPNAILKHQIPYYPTVKLFIDSQEHQLPLTEMHVGDPKCAAKVVNWVNRFIHKDHVMESVGDFEKFAENNPLLAIGLFNDERDGEFFKHCTRHFDDVFFAIAYGQVAEDIVDHLYNRRKISSRPAGFPAIILLYLHDDHHAIYQGELDYRKVDNFILSRRVPLITEYTSEGAETLLSSGMPVLYLIRDKDTQAGKEAEVNLRELAKDFLGSLLFSVCDISGGHHIDNLLNELGVDPVVSDNFEDIVMNDEHDVLVNYFAPWCGHCRQLSGIYSSLGEKVKHLSSTLKIVKVDATQNELPFRVDVFPTIALYPAGRKHAPVAFHGPRTVDRFIEFLKENAVHQLTDKPPVYDAYGNMQTRKTCFDKCIAKNGRFVDQLGKNEQICLAKCMDRMFESYSIVTKASAEMAQNLQSSLDQEQQSSSSSFL